MTMPSQDDRFAPPQSYVADVDPEDSSLLASRWSRLGAAIIDGIIIIALMWLAAKVTPWNPLQQKNPGVWSAFELGNALGGFAIYMLVNGYLLATRGQTVGKLLVGLRIVRADGSPAQLGRIVGLRYGVGSLIGIVPTLAMVYSLLDAVFIFHSSRRCLHDRIADTIVIKI